MQTETHEQSDMDRLKAELARLGCGSQYCGVHGFVLAPQRSGGLNIENGLLHFWDLGVNAYLRWESAHQALASLPCNAGYEEVRQSLLQLDAR